jgi:murein DD-endopeptidase MepM/ murein hydrolase activator NlpD
MNALIIYDTFFGNTEHIAVAMHSAVVLSAFDGWQPGSERVGGNHVWLYNPAQDVLQYYAHLNRILVKPGDNVPAGAPIGTIGRTGMNAYPHRSPTHVRVIK